MTGQFPKRRESEEPEPKTISQDEAELAKAQAFTRVWALSERWSEEWPPEGDERTILFLGMALDATNDLLSFYERMERAVELATAALRQDDPKTALGILELSLDDERVAT